MCQGGCKQHYCTNCEQIQNGMCTSCFTAVQWEQRSNDGDSDYDGKMDQMSPIGENDTDIPAASDPLKENPPKDCCDDCQVSCAFVSPLILHGQWY